MLRAVGLRGDGGTGDLRGARGDLRDRLGLEDGVVVAVEMFKDNLGLEALEASMLTECDDLVGLVGFDLG